MIRSQQALSSDDKEDELPPPSDLRSLLKRRAKQANDVADNDLCLKLNASKSRRINDPVSVQRPNDKLNANAEDLRILLNRSKSTDLCRKLDRQKQLEKPTSSQPDSGDISLDLRTFLSAKRVNARPRLNVIMGGSPPFGDSVRSVKDNRRQATTSQPWPLKPPSHTPISFSPGDMRVRRHQSTRRYREFGRSHIPRNTRKNGNRLQRRQAFIKNTDRFQRLFRNNPQNNPSPSPCLWHHSDGQVRRRQHKGALSRHPRKPVDTFHASRPVHLPSVRQIPWT